jgi:uncharacterized protein (TIGR03435 family)
MAGRAALTIRRSMEFVLLFAVLGTPAAWSQTAPDTPAPGDASALFAAYDVVSVKPSNIDGPHASGVRPLPDGIDAPAVTVLQLVYQAYIAPLNLPGDVAVTGQPDWARTDHFSVQAKMSPDQVAAFAKLSVQEQNQRRRAMLQALLADCFKLKLHMVNRPVPVYELVVAKGGLKMKESDSNPDGRKLSDGRPVPFSMTILPNGEEKVTTQGNTMGQFVNWIMPSAGLDHTVVDKTGLAGKYSFTLTFVAEGGVGSAGPTGASASDPAPLIFQALEAQLGLRLQRATDSIGVVIVDQVEKPMPN